MRRSSSRGDNCAMVGHWKSKGFCIFISSEDRMRVANWIAKKIVSAKLQRAAPPHNALYSQQRAKRWREFRRRRVAKPHRVVPPTHPHEGRERHRALPPHSASSVVARFV